MDYDFNPEEHPRRRAASGLLVVLAVLVGSFSLANGPARAMSTPSVSAAIFAYDVPTIASVGVHEIEAAEVSPAQLSVAQEGSASPAVEGRSTSTTSSSSVVATNSGQRVFRAVEPDELADLASSGQFRLGGWAEGLEGKYFWPTQTQADDFAAMMTKAEIGGPYCVTSGCIPSNVLSRIQAVPMDGLGPAYFIPEEYVPLIDDIMIHGG